jgi:hypothetical protein
MPIFDPITAELKPAMYQPLDVARARHLSLANLGQTHDANAQALDEGALTLQQKRVAVQRDADFRQAIADSVKPAAAAPAADQSMQIVAPPLPGVPQGAPAVAPAAGLNPGMTVKDQNIDGLVNTLRAKGLGPEADNLIKTFNENQKSRALADKDFSEGAKFRQDTEDKKRIVVGQELESLAGTDPAARPAAWTASIHKMENAGYIKPGDEPYQYPGDAEFRRLHASYLTHADMIANQEDARKAELQPSAVAQSQAKATTEDIGAQQMKKLGMSQKERETLDRQTEQNQNTAAYQQGELKNSAARTNIAAQELGLSNKRFNATLGAGLDANGQPLPADAVKTAAMADPAAVAMAKYQLPPPSPRSAVGQAMLRKVLAIDPTYDGTQFQARNKTALDFSAAGASGKAITSADTALAHLDTLSKAGAGLKSSNIQVLNQIANAVGAQAGSSPQTVYDSIVSMVAPEISKAVIGAAGGEGERGGMALNFGSKLSDAQREGNIGAAAGLLGARVHKQAQAYESTMGRPLDRKLSPESQSVLDRYTKPAAAGGATVRVVSPDGKSGSIPAANLAEALKRGFKKADQ